MNKKDIGILSLLISMSVYLARSVAKTNRELSGQLEQVERLSAEIMTDRLR